MKTTDITLTRINNDVNGNPRYVVHFLMFITPKDTGDISDKYDLAVKRAKAIGGKKYHTKSYGGGIVFQSHNTNELTESIVKMFKANSK
jgi:hypothetical protein